ncbi:L,D-transpeptidase family protein [Alicyclobacillus sp. SO9]|uniref:L,D-transpeptidase family protein n=1 Tax=Alicyclobacillus sp. SO9 TaxID=2665646 RepID=UPI0018E812D6|nr:L,D-transpeptidase family protein [Alicyclobacillus sp. SO9]QQE81015.1 L,D-transpeptidase family protein [Alicyclobacillus sp. SO9]
MICKFHEKPLFKAFFAVTMTYTCLGMLNPPACSADTAKGLPVSRGYSIHINLEQPQLKLYKMGRLVKTYPVALGKPSTPTPIGKWKIIDKQKDWGSGFGSRWLGLNVSWGTYGIHGTNSPQSIGQYVSNGCIRMYNSDVEELYKKLPLRTTVVIEGDPLRSLRVLEYGNAGADVQLVQRRLKQLGYFQGKCDGRFGPVTQFAVTNFQLANRLPMVGSVGLREYKELGLIKRD